MLTSNVANAELDKGGGLNPWADASGNRLGPTLPINRNIERLSMGTRGRKSAAELGVVHGIPQRPGPPDELTPEQADEWRAVVGRMPVDWFGREIFPLLLQYCRHVVHARHIGKLIDAAHDMDIGDRKALMRLNRLLAMQERQTNALMGLATKLRMTNQSRFTPQAAATRAKGRRTGKPLWED